MQTNFINSKKSCWNYLKEIESILVEVGLDHAMNNSDVDLPSAFHRLSLDNYKHMFFNEINDKNSLQVYKLCKKSTFRENYLFGTTDFESRRLKFKARTDCLGLQSDFERWGQADGHCKMCKKSKEDLQHFLLNCPILENVRIKLFNELFSTLISSCPRVWETFIHASPRTKVYMLLGNEDMDGAFRSFLKEAWAFRREILNTPG